MRLWETEKFLLNFKTGELIRSLDTMYIQGENFEHAQKRLLESKMDWLRLTGSWIHESRVSDDKLPEDFDSFTPNGFNYKDNAQDRGYEGGYDDSVFDDDDDDLSKLKANPEPKVFTSYSVKDWMEFKRDKVAFLESLDLDQTLDWLTTLDRNQVEVVKEACREYGLTRRMKVVNGHLRYRYGEEN